MQWRNVDQWPDLTARQTAYRVFNCQKCWSRRISAEVDADDPDCVPYLRFSDDAQGEFDQWRERLERRLRSDDEHPAMESHLAKFRSLIPSLALLIHLADEGRGPVGVDAVRQAIAGGNYLESHARRIYAAAINPDAVAARCWPRKSRWPAPGTSFPCGTCIAPAGLVLPAVTMLAAVELLMDLDWLRPAERPTEGRTATVFLVNPGILDADQRPTAKADKSPAGGSVPVPSVRSVSTFLSPVVNSAADQSTGADDDGEVEWTASLG